MDMLLSESAKKLIWAALDIPFLFLFCEQFVK
jgi:hypothetical protein